MLERLGRRLKGSVLLWDVLLTLLALPTASAVRRTFSVGRSIDPLQARFPWQLYATVALIWILIFLLLTPQRALFAGTLVEAIGRLLAAVALALLTYAGVLYLSYREISRLQFLYFAIIDFGALLVLHVGVRLYDRVGSRYSLQRRMLIVGGGEQAEQLVYEFEQRPWVRVQVVGCTSDGSSSGGHLPVLGPIAATPEIVAEQRIDEVIFVTLQQNVIADISMQLSSLPVMIHMVPGLLDLAFARTSVETLGGIPLISLRESALSEPQRLLKRFFDIIGSLLLLTIFSPFLVLIAILIKLDSPGPVFFRQERVGEHGQRFKMIKFRSMYQDAEQRWHEVAQRHPDGYLVHKRDDDPRITTIGRKLRRTSLDELPQLINVLRGEMSLVGPRPEMPYMTAEYKPWQWKRFCVPSGMTGWWQVTGRSDRPMHLNTEDDLFYIQHYSFWLDIKILIMTVGVVLKGRGAF